MADVPQRQAPQQGVAQGMDGDIAVGVGYKAGFGRDADAAQPHRQAFGQCMHVITVANSNIHSTKIISG